MTRSRQGGFTLLEILVALAILGLSAGVMMGALRTAAAGAQAAAARAAALCFARSLLAAQNVGPEAFGERSGVAQGFKWDVTVKPWPAGGAAPSVGLYFVAVAVAGADGGAPVRLTTLEIGPAYAAR